MRSVFTCLVVAILSLCASRAESGLVVTSYRTVAQTNGYAPTNQSQYFAEQRLEKISPAVAEVSGDWTGPNADAIPNTWRFVGASQASSTTTITPESYRVEAAGSFAYTLDTTADFVDPRLSSLIFGPSATVNYRGFFETTELTGFAITARLNQWSRVQLISAQGAVVFIESNPEITPRFLAITGSLPAGRFNILATAGLGVANQPAGIVHVERSGSFENLVFTVSVPEPSILGLGTISFSCIAMRRITRRSLRS